jgi:hypothetical protein
VCLKHRSGLKSLSTETCSGINGAAMLYPLSSRTGVTKVVSA